MNDLKLFFRSVKGRCHGNHFLLVLSTELKGDSLKAARRLAAQPGGLMLGFAPHLVICIFRCILLYTCVYFRVY